MKTRLPTLLLAYSALPAQTPPATPVFDIASVRLSGPNERGGGIVADHGTLTISNVPMKNCLMWAFDIQAVQFQSPAWFSDLRVSIAAKAAGVADDDQLRLMLRSLLTERFAIKLHHDRRDVPTYALTVAKGGPKFHDSAAKDASKFLQSTTEGPPAFTSDKAGLIANRAPISGVAEKLSDPLGRPVLDKTGLTGRYDIRIDIRPYLNPDGGDAGHVDFDPLTVIFSALKGQLGLNVEPSKDIVDYLVIDAADKVPSEN